MKKRILLIITLALLAAGAIATYAIDIPCGGDLWPPCDTYPPGKGGGGN
jgi:hypothetical protein